MNRDRRSIPSPQDIPPLRRADDDAFLAGLTALGRHFGIAIAASGGIRRACRRGEFANVGYLAHLPSGHLEPHFPGDGLDLPSGELANPTRQAEYDAFVAGLTALTRRHGIVLFVTGGVYEAAWPGEFAHLTYLADLARDRLVPCLPEDGKGTLDAAGPIGTRFQIGERIAYRLPNGRRGHGLFQGWRQGRLVIRHRLGDTQDVAEADCEYCP